jgi:hypothetical protein
MIEWLTTYLIGNATDMTYKDRTFCSQSYECSNEECQYWVDFEVDTDEAISLANYKNELCGYIEVIDYGQSD